MLPFLKTRSTPFSIFFVLTTTLSLVSCSLNSNTNVVTTRKHKGEMEIDPYNNNNGVSSTLTLTVPPQPEHQHQNIWESQIYQTSGPGPTGAIPGGGNNKGPSIFNFVDPNTFRVKGDDGINDTRGTVRYNVLPNGYMAPGIITNKADENALFTQATGKGPLHKYTQATA